MSRLFDMFTSGDFDRKPMQPIMWPWPDPTDARVKALESELAETKEELARLEEIYTRLREQYFEEKVNACGHWKNANRIAKERDEWKRLARAYCCDKINLMAGCGSEECDAQQCRSVSAAFEEES